LPARPLPFRGSGRGSGRTTQTPQTPQTHTVNYIL
jgi:hypothetical protein